MIICDIMHIEEELYIPRILLLIPFGKSFHSFLWKYINYLLILATILKMFDRPTDTSLTINLLKCEFCHAYVRFLGCIVGQRQVKPIEARSKRSLKSMCMLEKATDVLFILSEDLFRPFHKCWTHDKFSEQGN